MHLKGFAKFIEKVPYLSGNKIIFVPLCALMVLTIGFCILFVFYSLPELLMNSSVDKTILAFFPVLGVLGIEAVGFTLVYQM